MTTGIPVTEREIFRSGSNLGFMSVPVKKAPTTINHKLFHFHTYIYIKYIHIQLQAEADQLSGSPAPSITQLSPSNPLSSRHVACLTVICFSTFCMQRLGLGQTPEEQAQSHITKATFTR